MKDEFKKTIIDIVARECAKVRELQNKLFRSFVESLCVCLYHLDKADYEKAKDVLLQTIIALEIHQEGMEE